MKIIGIFIAILIYFSVYFYSVQPIRPYLLKPELTTPLYFGGYFKYDQSDPEPFWHKTIKTVLVPANAIDRNIRKDLWGNKTSK